MSRYGNDSLFIILSSHICVLSIDFSQETEKMNSLLENMQDLAKQTSISLLRQLLHNYAKLFRRSLAFFFFSNIAGSGRQNFSSE